MFPCWYQRQPILHPPVVPFWLFFGRFPLYPYSNLSTGGLSITTGHSSPHFPAGKQLKGLLRPSDLPFAKIKTHLRSAIVAFGPWRRALRPATCPRCRRRSPIPMHSVWVFLGEKGAVGPKFGSFREMRAFLERKGWGGGGGRLLLFGVFGSKAWRPACPELFVWSFLLRLGRNPRFHVISSYLLQLHFGAFCLDVRTLTFCQLMGSVLNH